MYCTIAMAHFCAITGCSNWSHRAHNFTSHWLPLKREKVLKELVHKIGRMNLQFKNCIQICSEQLVKLRWRMLRHEEVRTLTINIPTHTSWTQVTCTLQTPRRFLIWQRTKQAWLEPEPRTDPVLSTNKDANINTDLTYVILHSLVQELKGVMKKLWGSGKKCEELEKNVYCG